MGVGLTESTGLTIRHEIRRKGEDPREPIRGRRLEPIWSVETASTGQVTSAPHAAHRTHLPHGREQAAPTRARLQAQAPLPECSCGHEESRNHGKGQRVVEAKGAGFSQEEGAAVQRRGRRLRR